MQFRPGLFGMQEHFWTIFTPSFFILDEAVRPELL
jgi:hypothetical protein